ncbi:MAG: hypothetical protein FD180_3367 [Planctomycetota bacterium]|nr:MAG: hypothetical protein FD180_3367 [Planctomycetota bacterium]
MKQIIVLGGGGFSMEPDNPRLDDYILKCTGRKRPRICFLGTASGDADGYIERFHKAFKRKARASHLKLFGTPRTDIRRFLLMQHAIFVGGGNTANMLAIWRVHGVDRFLGEAWRRGVVLSGISAGMICWFEAGVTDSFGPLAPLRDGLGLLPGSACPHYDGDKKRRPAYHRFVRAGFPGGYAADDGAALHFVGTKLFDVVKSRPGAKGYRVARVSGRVVETSLPPSATA